MTRTRTAFVVAALAAAASFIGCPDNKGASTPPPPPPSAGTTTPGTPAAPPPPANTPPPPANTPPPPANTPPPPPPANTPPPPPVNPGKTGPTGTIRGRVVSAPKDPPAPVNVAKDAHICGNVHNPESLRISADGGVANAVVYIKGLAAPAGWDKSGSHVMDQVKCHYTPRVIVVPLGGTVTFRSQDDTLHNVKCAKLNYNEGISKGAEKKLACKMDGFHPLECNVHPFMAGWLVVAENPWYVVTDESGSFKLENVPVGKHKVSVNHEVLRKAPVSPEVTVEEGKETVVELKY